MWISKILPTSKSRNSNGNMKNGSKKNIDLEEISPSYNWSVVAQNQIWDIYFKLNVSQRLGKK